MAPVFIWITPDTEDSVGGLLKSNKGKNVIHLAFFTLDLIQAINLTGLFDQIAKSVNGDVFK